MLRVYNETTYIYDREFKKKLKSLVMPKKSSFSGAMYSYIDNFYFYKSHKILFDYENYKSDLSLENYLKEILLVPEDDEIDFIVKNKKKLFVKREYITDPINVFNYFHNYNEFEDELSVFIQESMR